MAATKTTTDNADPITIISKDMTKHIRHLERNIEKLRKLPKPDDILEGMKHELWYKMCTLCRSTIYELSSKNFSAWKEGINTSHHLEDQEMIEELKNDNAVLGNIIKEKDKKIRDLEQKMKGNTKGVTLTTKDRGNDTKHQTAGTGEVKTRSQTKQDNRNLPDRTNEEEKRQFQIANVQKKKDRKVTNTSRRKPRDITLRADEEIDEKKWSIVNLPEDDREEIKKKLENIPKENGRIETEIKEIETERKILQDQTDSLKRINDELTTALKTKDQSIDKLTEEQVEMQEAYDKINEEKEKCIGEVSQLQAERQTLQYQADCLNRAVEDLSSMYMKCIGEVSQLQAERQTLQYQADCLNRAVEDLSSMLKAKEQSIDKLTRELEKSTQTGQYHRQETSTQTESQREVDRKSKASCSFTAGSSKDAMQHEQERLRSDLHRISQERDQIQKRYDYLTFELSQLDQTNSEQRNQITHLVMRLLRTSQSGLEKTMVDMVTEEITRQVGGRLDPRNFDFSIVPSETSAGVSKGPLFVVCLNSMVGKNVPDALERPKGGRDVYLLVLHQTTRENVSTLRPDSLRNNGNELQQLGGVIDMVFSSESGLVECDVNKTAVDHIATVLKKY